MIRFNEYKTGTWKVNSIEDRKKVEEDLYTYAASQNETFSDEDVRVIFEDYDFIESGRYKTAKAYHDVLWEDLKNASKGDDHHEKIMYKAYARLLKENNLWADFCGGRFL